MTRQHSPRPGRGRPDSLDALAVLAILSALVLAMVARSTMPPTLAEVWETRTARTATTYAVVTR